VISLLEDAFASWSMEALLPRLAEIGVPAGRVRTLDEVYEWDQTRSQGLVVPVEHATLGTVELPGPPLRFFATDGTEVTRTSHTAPPTLGEHDESVRSWLGA
jgi:crotonobetainyl-CoA:carnitine CoA-transferase CaiB-like acyl-CoA transferase